MCICVLGWRGWEKKKTEPPAVGRGRPASLGPRGGYASIWARERGLRSYLETLSFTGEGRLHFLDFGDLGRVFQTTRLCRCSTVLKSARRKRAGTVSHRHRGLSLPVPGIACLRNYSCRPWIPLAKWRFTAVPRPISHGCDSLEAAHSIALAERLREM